MIEADYVTLIVHGLLCDMQSQPLRITRAVITWLKVHAADMVLFAESKKSCLVENV